MNEVIFPRRIDFGVCAVGETHARAVRLRCKVPISFEYHLMVDRPHAAIRIGPLAGVVPANGEVRILIEYAPAVACTAEAQISVDVSQFGFEPFVCVVAGSAAPGIARTAAKAAAARKLGSTLELSLGRAQYEPRDGSVIPVSPAWSRRNFSPSKSWSASPARGTKAGVAAAAIAKTSVVTAAGAAALDTATTATQSDGEMAPHRRKWEGEGNATEEEGEEELDDDVRQAALLDTWIGGGDAKAATAAFFGTGTGSGAAFDAGGAWLAQQRKGLTARRKAHAKCCDGGKTSTSPEASSGRGRQRWRQSQQDQQGGDPAPASGDDLAMVRSR
ncbi:unnamed protein product [Phaeothamnion confervicola]